MIVDCDRCEVRGNACQDCVITVLFGAPPEGVELDGAERRALDTLTEVGMMPRLLLVDHGEAHNGTEARASGHVRIGDERPVTSDERSARYVC